MIRKLKLMPLFLAAPLVTAAVAYAAASPTVSTGSASSVHSTSATLNGTVNPNGSTTYYRFEYGLTTGYGLGSATKPAGSGTTSTPAAAGIGGLLPGTVYHYRLTAVNSSGSALGGDRTFKTTGNPPPDAATGPSRVTSPSSVTLTGIINPNNQSTTFYFLYGPVNVPTAFYSRSGYGTVSGKTPVAVSMPLFGLSPGTHFRYHLVAVHTNSSGAGLDESFLTFPAPRPKPRVPAETHPGRARFGPYVFNTSGRIVGPAAIPKVTACFGNALLTFLQGSRPVTTTIAPVMPDCTFKARTVFTRIPGGGPTATLRLRIHFRGTGYLFPADAREERVVLG